MNPKLAGAIIETINETLEADTFFVGRSESSQISDLRWSIIKLAEAVAAILPEEPS